MSETSPSGQIDDLPSLSIRRPVLVLVVNLLIALAGLAAILAIEVRELPDVDRPIVTVRAVYPGASPETMDAEVISRIEGAVARVLESKVSPRLQRKQPVESASSFDLASI